MLHVSRASARALCKPALALRSGAGSGRLVRCMSSAGAAAAAKPAYHLLQYTYVADILDKRGPHREAHLAAARQKGSEGKIVLAGALLDPVDGAVFVWKGSSREEIEEFVKTDPYVVNGLVPSWKIRDYAVVVP